MANNKDEILADFQNITAIDDVGEAFSHLEESNWNLMTAIQRVMPQESTWDTEATGHMSEMNNFNTFEDPMQGTNVLSSPEVPSTSRNDVIDLTSNLTDIDTKVKESKPITFNIHFNQRIFAVLIRSSATVGDLKNRINNLTSVPVCRQVIRGWPPAKIEEARNSQSKLSTLNLAEENDLILIDMTEDGYMDDDSETEASKRMEETFTLHIVQQPEGTLVSLKFPGKRTILEVKTDIYSITDIPVRYQEWVGWPTGASNTTTLAQSGIEFEHNLVLRSSCKQTKNNIKSNKPKTFINVDSESSADEFEDASDFNADDDLFSDSPAQPKLNYLIPDQTDDETVGCIQFVENYMQRYGAPHPLFFQGSLEDALKEACLKSAKDRKLLAIYLHHDESVLTNVFCDQLLRCESVMQTLAHNFILYGWDLTHESNKNLFLSSISACVGVTASITARNIPVDRLPAIIIVGKNRSNCEVLCVINGNVGVDDLLSRLMEAVELYAEQIKVEVDQENERAAREQVKYEQDMAYQQALEADMAKEALRKQKEQALEAERKRIESEKAEAEALKEASRLQAERALPAEPNAPGEDVTKIRVRKPTGDHFERRFYKSNKLQALLDFVASKGFPIEEYKVITVYPRKDLTAINQSETLESLKLYPQETVTLEER